MTRSKSVALALVAGAALAFVVTGCAHTSSSPALAPGVQPVSVPASTLWDPNAAQDPVVSYRLRLGTEPDNPALHNNLANLYVLRNWMDEAVEEYKKAIDLSPTSATAWNNLGTTYHKMGKSSAAMSAFKRATELDPHYALAWYNIGTLFDEAGEYDRAIEMYLKAASFNPGILEPEVNPQVINNQKLMAVRLKRYLEEGGNLSLPLEPMPE